MVCSIVSADYWEQQTSLNLQDTTFEMERKRNRPEKYNRETMNQTVKAINKITEVLTWPFSQSISLMQYVGHSDILCACTDTLWSKNCVPLWRLRHVFSILWNNTMTTESASTLKAFFIEGLFFYKRVLFGMCAKS